VRDFVYVGAHIDPETRLRPVTLTVLAVFARAIGFFVRAPGFARANVPASVRVIFALAFAYAVAPSISRPGQRDAPAFVLLIASETVVGAVFGLGATLVAEAAAAAGRVLDDLVGLRASVPGIQVAPAGFGGLWMLVFIAAFFAIGGIDVMIAAFAHTFAAVPLGSALDAATLRSIGLGFGARFARICFQLAAPAICVSLCVQIGIAALTRVIPRFANLSIAFPAAYGAVLLATFVSLASLRDLAVGR
jgi:flagellar biosynthesis protein FliR